MTKLDALISALEATDIPFARDAWIEGSDTMTDSAYGVVEVTGKRNEFWLDNTLDSQDLDVSVYLYVPGTDDTKAKSVQTVLAAWRFGLEGSEYLPDTEQTRWTWSAVLEDGLIG